MTYNPEWGGWEINFVRDDEAAAREELKRLHGKACYGIQLFVMEEVTDARSPYFPGGLVPNAG